MSAIPLNSNVPSAPSMYDIDDIDINYIQNQLKFIEKETNDLNLALLESELENIIQQVTQLEENLCDKQCEKINESIEPNTLEDFLKKDMNNIFKEE